MKIKTILTVTLIAMELNSLNAQSILYASNENLLGQTNANNVSSVNKTGEIQNVTNNSSSTSIGKTTQAPKVTSLSYTVGGVGIGTETPFAKLDITHASSASNPHLLLVEDSPNNGAKLVFKNSGSANSWELNGTPAIGSDMASLKFNYNGGSGDVMMLAGNGNIGIGTETPDYRLDVKGVMRAEEIIVETGWADYVFADNYDLKKLTDVEKFINENKHLPGIPSAQEIQDNGAPISELVTKMMSKIEELTLYSIQQQKEIEKLKSNQNKGIFSKIRLFKTE